MLESIYTTLEEITIPLEKIEVEFGLKVSAGANVIVSAGTEANFMFRISWNKSAVALKPSAS